MNFFAANHMHFNLELQAWVTAEILSPQNGSLFEKKGAH